MDEKEDKKFEEQIEKDLEENIEKDVENFFKGCGTKSDIIEPIMGVVFMGLFLILFNIFYDRLSFLTDDFDDIKNVYNAALLIGIFLNMGRIFIRSFTFKVVTEVINTIVIFYVAYLFWTVYPFDPSVIGGSDLWDWLFKFFIIVPPFAMLIGTLVDIGKLISQGTDGK